MIINSYNVETDSALTWIETDCIKLFGDLRINLNLFVYNQGKHQAYKHRFVVEL